MNVSDLMSVPCHAKRNAFVGTGAYVKILPRNPRRLMISFCIPQAMNAYISTREFSNINDAEISINSANAPITWTCPLHGPLPCEEWYANIGLGATLYVWEILILEGVE